MRGSAHLLAPLQHFTMSTQQPSKLAVIFAGEVMPEPGKPALLDVEGNPLPPIRVRAMPARHLGRVLRLADREAELLDFVCMVFTKEGEETEPTWKTVPEGWADILSDESHVELYEAAKRLNFSRATKWAERQIAAKQLVADVTLKAEEVLQPLMQQIVASVASSLQPSAPRAPATPKS